MAKVKESCSPYFAAEDSAFTKKNDQKKAILTSNMESTGIPLIYVKLLQEASNSIIKLVQAKHFNDELSKLKQKERSLSKASCVPLSNL